MTVSEIVSKDRAGSQADATKQRPQRKAARKDPRRTGEHTAINTGEVRASMHGLVKEILVKKGARVANGQRLLVFEAMKMESDIVALKDGTVTDIAVSPGETVDNQSLLLTIGD